MLFAGAVEMEFAPVATVSQTPAQNKWDGNRTCHTLANRVALRRRHNPPLRRREWPQTCRSESATALIPNSKMPDAPPPTGHPVRRCDTQALAAKRYRSWNYLLRNVFTAGF